MATAASASHDFGLAAAAGRFVIRPDQPDF
jgi:hypothetical protein